MNISKWGDSEPDGNDDFAEISKNGSLFIGIPRNDKRNAYICEMPGGKIAFQPESILCAETEYYSRALVS